MKITINNNKEFKNVIKNIVSIVDTNSIRPVLECLNFIVVNGSLQIIAANEIISISKIINKTNYEVDGNGSFLVNGKIFEQIISKIKEDKVLIQLTQDNSLYIKSAKSEYFINLYRDNDYPNINFTHPEDEAIEMNSNKLKRAIKRTIYSASEKDQRVILNGINIRLKENVMIFTGTDGFRVARFSTSVNSNKDFSETIHIKAMKEINKLISSESQLKMWINSEWLYINDNGTLIKSKVIDGIFPNVDRVFPKDRDNSMTIRKSEILDMIDSVLVINSMSAEISVSISKDELRVKNNQLQIGNAEIVSNEHMYSGITPVISFSVNPKYLVDAIRNLEAEEIQLDINDSFKPIVISSPEDKAVFNLIQPLKM